MRDLEFVTDATDAADATDAGEVVSSTAARTPPSTRAGGQDDGSYTNSLKLINTLTYYSILNKSARIFRHI